MKFQQNRQEKDSKIAEGPIAKPRTPNAESTRTQLVNSLASLGERVQSLRELRNKVGVRISAVQESEAGKRIAGSEEHFPLLKALITFHAQGDKKIDQVASRVDSELVAEEVSGITDAEFRKTLNQVPLFEEDLLRASNEIQEVENSILTLEFICKSTHPTSKTVKSLIEEQRRIEAESASAHAESVKIAATQSREAKLTALRLEKTEAERLLMVSKEQLIKAREKSKALDMQIESDLTQKLSTIKDTKKFLEQEFQRDKVEIDRYLKVLMVDGFKQPESSGYQINEATSRKVSLTKLIGCGALNNTPVGVNNLALAMT